jgi:hypothetical protein
MTVIPNNLAFILYKINTGAYRADFLGTYAVTFASPNYTLSMTYTTGSVELNYSSTGVYQGSSVVTGSATTSSITCVLYANTITYNGSHPAWPTYDISAATTVAPTTGTIYTEPKQSLSLTGKWYNPTILSDAQLASANQADILIAIYRINVASIGIALALVVFYYVFKLGLWFFPRYWHLPRKDDE